MAPERVINFNVDAGESYGNYRFGLDEELIGLIPTVNVACGAHAGDPHVMRQTVALAAEAGAEIGAHVGLPDRVGFGRRWIEIEPLELADLVTFQIGALAAFARNADVPLTHVKPHGVLYNYAGRHPEFRAALLDAVAAFDPGLRVIVGGNPADHPPAPAQLRVTNEAYLDLDVDAGGYPVIERKKGHIDPDLAVERALAVALGGKFPSREAGGEIDLPVPTICVHSDTPNAVELVYSAIEALKARDVRVTGLADAMEATGRGQ